MSNHTPANVYAAFEMLLEEIEATIDAVNQDGAQAMAERSYGRTQTAIEQARKLIDFRTRVDALRNDWDNLVGSPTIILPTEDLSIPESVTDDTDAINRISHGRLQRGLRTPERAYYQPILKTLKDLGGRAKIQDVLERVELMMRGTLSDVDYLPLNSDPDMHRWRNAAQWARNAMVKEGLLKDDSPRGIWEIS